MSTTAMSVASGASALVPFTQTFVQTSGSETTTVAYTLVGQVLDNGQTNWVGYDEGSAEYLYTGSVANAQETTIGGDTYYVSSGSAPAGYLATESGDDDTTATTSGASVSETASGGSASTTGLSSSSSTTSGQTSSTASGSAAETSQPSAGHRMSAGAAFALAVGLLAVITL